MYNLIRLESDLQKCWKTYFCETFPAISVCPKISTGEGRVRFFFHYIPSFLGHVGILEYMLLALTN